MDTFSYRDGRLFCEGVEINTIAEKTGTPVYIYSAGAIVHNLKRIDDAWATMPHTVCYAAKANSNIAILRLLVQQGAGMEVLTGGELFRCLAAGTDPRKIIFTGVGKTVKEMEYALKEGIFLFVVESVPELLRLNEVAADLGKTASFSIRINPDVDPLTHAHITTGKAINKFGIDTESALEAYRQSKEMSHLAPVGIHMHIGSQILSTEPYVAAIRKLLPLIQQLKEMGIQLEYLDLGGGMGIAYEEAQKPFAPEKLAAEIAPLIKDLNMTVILEPGRSLVGDAGVLVTTVQYLKQTPAKKFVVVDAGMNDLIRPALYDAYHRIVPIVDSASEVIEADIVGPLCESGDTFARSRRIPVVRSGERLAIMSAGAYSSVMSSEYNSRPKCPEVLVQGEEFFVIRDAASFQQLIENERMPDFLGQVAPTTQ